jgi:hypothetical protein
VSHQAELLDYLHCQAFQPVQPKLQDSELMQGVEIVQHYPHQFFDQQ